MDDNLNLSPPQSIEAEQNMLGSMLLHRDAVADVISIIPPEQVDWLYRNNHRIIYQMILEIYNDNNPMDIVVVKERLRKAGKLDEVGGIAYIVELAERVGSWANVEYYAGIVREKGLLRDVISACGKIRSEAYADASSAQDVLDFTEQTIFDVTQKRVSGQIVTIEDSICRVQTIDSGEQKSGLKSGFFSLDELTTGFQFGDLIIIAGRPSMGKTAIGLSIAEYMAVDENMPVLFFSMEMSNLQIARRLICARARVSSHSYRARSLTPDEEAMLIESATQFKRSRLFTDETPNQTVMEVRAKARRAQMQFGIKAVFVDYLQLMRCPGKESRQQEIAEISRGLKALGRELNIPIVAMAQLNRAAESREGNRPRMSDLRESGAIEQDADVVLLLHREEYYQRGRPEGPSEDVKGVAEIIIAKQRNGPTGTVRLQFDSACTRFNNLAPIIDEYQEPKEETGTLPYDSAF